MSEVKLTWVTNSSTMEVMVTAGGAEVEGMLKIRFYAWLPLIGSHHELITSKQHQLLGTVVISRIGMSLSGCPSRPLGELFGFGGRVFHILQFLLAFLWIESPSGGELRPVI